MKYIKDFFYNFNDIIFSIIIILLASFIVYRNMDYLTKVENLQSSITISSDSETVEEIENKISVNIPTGTTIEQLGDLLLSYGIINNAEEFTSNFNDKEVIIKSGTFELTQNMSIDELKSLLVE